MWLCCVDYNFFLRYFSLFIVYTPYTIYRCMSFSIDDWPFLSMCFKMDSLGGERWFLKMDGSVRIFPSISHLGDSFSTHFIDCRFFPRILWCRRKLRGCSGKNPCFYENRESTWHSSTRLISTPTYFRQCFSMRMSSNWVRKQTLILCVFTDGQFPFAFSFRGYTCVPNTIGRSYSWVELSRPSNPTLICVALGCFCLRLRPRPPRRFGQIQWYERLEGPQPSERWRLNDCWRNPLWYQCVWLSLLG